MKIGDGTWESGEVAEDILDILSAIAAFPSGHDEIEARRGVVPRNLTDDIEFYQLWITIKYKGEFYSLSSPLLQTTYSHTRVREAMWEVIEEEIIDRFRGLVETGVWR